MRLGGLPLIHQPGTPVNVVGADLDDVYVAGEGGLMDLVVHPDSRTVTCSPPARQSGRPVYVGLVSWELSSNGAPAGWLIHCSPAWP
ncbi:MAG TPA: hypothetical protein VE673_11165 [Pseudonocardiaceae bacterium]|nr:hypothetical protein [Pseudonocardiaceae bacterium]